MIFLTRFALLLSFLLIATPLAPKHAHAAFNVECRFILDGEASPSQSVAIQIGAFLKQKKRLPKSSEIVAKISGFSMTDFETAIGLNALYWDKLVEGIGNIDAAVANGGKTSELILSFKNHTATTNLIESFEEKQSKTAIEKIFVKLSTEYEKTKRDILAQLDAQQKTELKFNRLLSEEEILKTISNYSHSELALKDLGVTPRQPGWSYVAEWRYRYFEDHANSTMQYKANLAKKLATFLYSTGEIPENLTELENNFATELGISHDEFLELFGTTSLFKSFDEIITQTYDVAPGDMKSVVDMRFFSQERENALLDSIRHNPNLIVTKIVEGQELFKPEVIANFSRKLNPALNPVPVLLSPAFNDLANIVEKAKLTKKGNENFFVNPLQELRLTKGLVFVANGVMDKAVNPLSEIPSLFPHETAIIASPKVLGFSPPYKGYDFGERPWISTSGAMCIPKYNAEFVSGLRTDFAAQKHAEENLGLTVISRNYVNPNFTDIGGAMGFGVRRAPYTIEQYGNPSGIFDLGKIYTADKVVQVPFIPALIPPDFHWGKTSPQFIKAFIDLALKLEMIKKNPKFGEYGEVEYIPGKVKLGAMTFHDGPDGTPFNAHLYDMLITLSKLDAKEALSIEQHYSSVAHMVNLLRQLFPDTLFVFPLDNHGHDWIAKFIQKGDLTKLYNQADLPIVLKLMLTAATEGGNPYEAMMHHFGIDTSNIRFMNRDDDLRVGIDWNNYSATKIVTGVNVGDHGDKGTNGMKSISLKTLRIAYKSGVFGHTHASGQEGNVVRVSAGTDDRQDYHQGPSTGGRASVALAYSEEAVQLLHMVRGSFYPNGPVQAPEQFFPAGFPMIKKKQTGVADDHRQRSQQTSNFPGSRSRSKGSHNTNKNRKAI